MESIQSASKMIIDMMDANVSHVLDYPKLDYVIDIVSEAITETKSQKITSVDFTKR